MRERAALIVVLMVGIAPSVLAQPADCLDIEVDRGVLAQHRSADSVYYLPPPRVQLRPNPNDTNRGTIVVPEGLVPSPHEESAWALVGDTLRIRWSTGHVGLHAQLVDNGDGWEGSARPFTDEGGLPRSRASTRLTAHPVACDAPTPHTLGTVRRFNPPISLSTGDTLQLGTRLPHPIEVPEAPMQLVDAPGLGFAEGSSEIVVGVDRQARAIRLAVTYPPGTDIDRLLQTLVAMVGPWHAHEDTYGLSSWYWGGRVESLSLSQHSRGTLHLRMHTHTTR